MPGLLHEDVDEDEEMPAPTVSNLSVARNMQENSIENSTRVQYERKVAHIVDWFRFSHPTVMTEDDQCPIDPNCLTKDMFPEFLGYICQKRGSDNLPKSPPEYYGYQHVNGYHSAFKYYLKQKCFWC